MSAYFIYPLRRVPVWPTLNSQIQKEVPYIPFKQWHRAKGVYTSGVKLNFNGPEYMAEARRLLNVFDNNMFVTAWVTTSLLEAFKYGDAPRLSDAQLLLSLNVSVRELSSKNLCTYYIMKFPEKFFYMLSEIPRRVTKFSL